MKPGRRPQSCQTHKKCLHPRPKSPFPPITASPASLSFVDGLNPDREDKLPLNVLLDGVQMITEKSFQATLTIGRQCQDESGRTIQSPNCGYYRLVFRPKGRTAELSISDWKSPSEPSGGLENQEIGFNFLELQPYYEGE